MGSTSPAASKPRSGAKTRRESATSWRRCEMPLRYGVDCTVYMGTEDMRRQAVNVERMRMLGAEVREVTGGTRTLKDATSEAIRDWVTNVRTTHYIIGSAVGPHPYPEMVRDFQRVIGDEARAQYLEAE